MRWAGSEPDAPGIAATYAGLIDGLVADEPVPAIPLLQTDLLMDTAPARRRLAAATLDFALALN
jgi:hypothetical protein